MQYAQEAETAPFDINALKGKLLEQVTNCISRDISAWDTSYVCKPSQFLVSKDSIFYAGVQGMADYECEHIVQAQLEDGSWPIPWGWADFPEAWAISKNWWKSDIIIKNIRDLAGVRDL